MVNPDSLVESSLVYIHAVTDEKEQVHGIRIISFPRYIQDCIALDKFLHQ